MIQVDDLLSFRQFSKKAADDMIDVSVIIICHVRPVECPFVQYSTTPMLVVQPVREKFRKISCQISAGSRN